MSDEIEEVNNEGGEVNADAIAEAFESEHHDDEDDVSPMSYREEYGDDEDDSIDTNFEIMDSEGHW